MVDKRALDFLTSLNIKDQRIIREKLKILQDNPYPSPDGDKEKLHTNKKRESYRLHIARSFTVIYNIDPDGSLIYITHIMPIEKAHRRYGAFEQSRFLHLGCSINNLLFALESIEKKETMPDNHLVLAYQL